MGQKTVCVQIGNSDDKLTQKEWHNFVLRINDILYQHEGERHFFGGPATWQLWQNTCWVSVVSEEKLGSLLEHLEGAKAEYSQDSIAVLIGDTQFV